MNNCGQQSQHVKNKKKEHYMHTTSSSLDADLSDLRERNPLLVLLEDPSRADAGQLGPGLPRANSFLSEKLRGG